GVGELVEQGLALALDPVGVGLELDLADDRDLTLAHDDPPAIRTAVAIAARLLGIVRALVVVVGDAVAVVVRLGAAVVVLEAVLVLGAARAAVVAVGDAVVVAVDVARGPLAVRRVAHP